MIISIIFPMQRLFLVAVHVCFNCGATNWNTRSFLLLMQRLLKLSEYLSRQQAPTLPSSRRLSDYCARRRVARCNRCGYYSFMDVHLRCSCNGRAGPSLPVAVADAQTHNTGAEATTMVQTQQLRRFVFTLHAHLSLTCLAYMRHCTVGQCCVLTRTPPVRTCHVHCSAPHAHPDTPLCQVRQKCNG